MNRCESPAAPSVGVAAVALPWAAHAHAQAPVATKPLRIGVPYLGSEPQPGDHAKPGEIPFEQGTKLALVVNLKGARALGVTIPQSVRVGADEVIE